MSDGGAGPRDGGRKVAHHRDASRERNRSDRERDGSRSERESRDRERGGRERDERGDGRRERDRAGYQHRGSSQHQQRSGSRAGGFPPRPQSSARAESESRGGAGADQLPPKPSGIPKRGSANPLVAEAARLARERLAREEAAAAAAAAAAGAGTDDESDGLDEPRRRAAWRDDTQREAGADTRSDPEGDGAAAGAGRRPGPGDAAGEEGEAEEGEEGELLPEAAGGGQEQGSSPPREKPSRETAEEAPASADKKKRKHAPIVWHTPPKLPKLNSGATAAVPAAVSAALQGGMHHAQSSSGIAALGQEGAAAGGGGGAAPRAKTAAEIAQAELEAFAAAQVEVEGGDEDGFMKDSPDVSSPEEDLHRRQEGEGGDSPGNVPSRPASRWLFDDADADPAHGPAPAPPTTAPSVGGGSPAVGGEEGGALSSSDAEQAAGGDDLADSDSDVAVAKRQVSMLDECRSVDRYEKLNRINEGTYGVVYRARDRDTGQICALKKVKLEKERDGFPLTSVREINILLSMHHPNIVNVSEVVVGASLDSVFMVMEYADHDLKAVMEDRMTQPFSIAEVKCLMRQLLSGVAYLHSHWVLHRDLKTSNILYTNRGELKLCDFGLARQYGSPLKPYTHMVVTLWYRAIELLLGCRTYSTAVDVWSCGCIMGELLAREPLFPGKNEMEQITLIFKTLGTPTEETWPGLSKIPNYKRFNFASGYPNVLRKKFPPPGLVFDGRPALSDAGFDLMSRLLEYSPERRISAQEALEHPWFREHPLPKDLALMPTFPATNDTVHRHGGGGAAKRKVPAAVAGTQ